MDRSIRHGARAGAVVPSLPGPDPHGCFDPPPDPAERHPIPRRLHREAGRHDDHTVAGPRSRRGTSDPGRADPHGRGDHGHRREYLHPGADRLHRCDALSRTDRAASGAEGWIFEGVVQIGDTDSLHAVPPVVKDAESVFTIKLRRTENVRFMAVRRYPMALFQKVRATGRIDRHPCRTRIAVRCPPLPCIPVLVGLPGHHRAPSDRGDVCHASRLMMW